MSAFIEEHRERFGVEPICSVLGVSASAFYERASGRRSARSIDDDRLLGRITELHEANYAAYGYGEPGRRCSGQARMSGATASSD